jgi:hypothetical protein
MEINLRLLAAIDDPYNLIVRYETLGRVAQERVEALMAEIVGEKLLVMAEESEEVRITISSLFTDLLQRGKGEYSPRRLLTLEAPASVLSAPSAEALGRGWFIGEY